MIPSASRIADHGQPVQRTVVFDAGGMIRAIDRTLENENHRHQQYEVYQYKCAGKLSLFGGFFGGESLSVPIDALPDSSATVVHSLITNQAPLYVKKLRGRRRQIMLA